MLTDIGFLLDVYLGANDSCPVTACYSGNPTLVIPVTNMNDVKTFEGQWNVYIKPGGNGEVFDEMVGKGPPPKGPRPSRPPNGARGQPSDG